MFTKKDVRDWMIEHKVYDDVDDVDESLQRNGDHTLRILSCSFYNNEGKFDRYFKTIGGKTYNSLPDEPELSYLDILDKL
jgi:hypothetical protein